MIKLFKTFLFSAVIAALSSCSQEENVPLNEMRGDLVVLKVNFDGIEEQKPARASTKTGEPEVQTFIEELGEDLYLETQVVADYSLPKTRFGSESDMVNGTAVTAIVYKSNGEAYKIQKMTKGSAELLLPAGGSFSVVFYTYNTTTHPEITYNGGSRPGENGSTLLTPGSSFADNTELSGTNVMWSRIENTGVITQSTRLPNVIFTPVFNRLKWTLTSDAQAFKVISAQIEQTYEKATVKMNELLKATDKVRIWTPSGSGKKGVPLTFDGVSGVRSVSERSLFIADESADCILGSAINVDDRPRSFKISLGKLARGVSYSAESKLVSSTSRVAVAPYICVSGEGDNATLVLATNVTDIPAYFQFGSIVGWSYSDPLKQVFNPSTLDSNWKSGWTVGTSFPAHNKANLKAGKGDPCRLVGLTQKAIKDALNSSTAAVPDNKKWKLPINSENSELVAQGKENETTVNGVKGRFFGSKGATDPKYSRMFFPYFGVRMNTDGRIGYQGTNGCYWSSSVIDSANGSHLDFTVIITTSEHKNPQALGVTVRCVPQ